MNWKNQLVVIDEMGEFEKKSFEVQDFQLWGPTWPYFWNLFPRARRKDTPSVIGQHTWVNTRNTEHCILQCILQLQSKDHNYPKKCAHGSYFLFGPYLNFSGAAAWNYNYISTINNLPVIYRAPQLIESKWNIQQGRINHCGSQTGILTISDFWQARHSYIKQAIFENAWRSSVVDLHWPCRHHGSDRLPKDLGRDVRIHLAPHRRVAAR